MNNETQGVFQNFPCFRQLNNTLLHNLRGVCKWRNLPGTARNRPEPTGTPRNPPEPTRNLEKSANDKIKKKTNNKK